MILERSKTNSKLKGLFILGCSIMLMCSFSFAQEKEVKTKSKELTAEDVEFVENIEISSDQELEFIPFTVVDKVPYPVECKGSKTKDDKKKCVVEFIQQHALKKFNTNLGTKLGLSPGKTRMLVRFKFDTSGKVIEVKGRASHPELEKEAERVIELLPKFTPGEHQGETVVVAYSLPVVLFIPEKEKATNKQ